MTSENHFLIINDSFAANTQIYSAKLTRNFT
nr:MAG TPA: hypothetical protein [Caudoviricetes sp.]